MDSRDIKRLIEGDEAAFRIAYEQFSERVYRLAFRFLKDKEQSEEIVQEVFLNLWLSRCRLDENGNMWLYLYVIAKRLCLNALREIHKSTDLFNRLLSNIKEASNVTEEEILAADIGRLAEEIVSKLPKQQQLIFRLSRAEGLSHQEIAERLSISPNTVKNHMVEALKTLRAHLKYTDLIYFIILIFR
ncbi:RNA polymerase sigma factor [Pararcticibacter amylolyticus]|uniref:RNA polymerase sigma-70 factor n=1 Tax=Pararcticibacter amylolyticus TaxID=2173175 RepID=A0A2U2PFV3_9SPHI|nr:RNA polymerase sigma-70 factor [Pararcticibacter amylolyticus]PWG80285.1 RNA polymerase sigma-70 factor [Pararcticibacter amylolyticus]